MPTEKSLPVSDKPTKGVTEHSKLEILQTEVWFSENPLEPTGSWKRGGTNCENLYKSYDNKTYLGEEIGKIISMKTPDTTCQESFLAGNYRYTQTR